MEKIKTLNELKQIIGELKEKGEKIIFTNGCFDFIHVGHVRYLKGASRLGDTLIVAINSDNMVKKIKGSNRPLIGENERAEIIANFECVDFVTIFDEPTVEKLLLALKPHVHAKGTDYTKETVPERETVLSYGGDIAITGDTKERSSREYLKRLKVP